MCEKAILFTDGGIKNNVTAYGFVVYNPEDTKEVLFAGKGISGNGSSNCAEYKALIAGLESCLKHKMEIVHICSDSQLICNQVNRVWKMNHEDLAELRERVWKLLEKFKSWSLKWVPREENKVADALCSEALDRKKKCKQKRK